MYLPAIEGYIPNKMVKALQAFLDFCYIVCHKVHDTQTIMALEDALDRFHQHRKIFVTTGICLSRYNLPCSHAAVHYLCLIRAFGAPNGLCSSITESKHIKAMKEPWRCSSQWNALKQMITTNSHLDKLAAACVDFASCGMLQGSVLEDMLGQLGKFSATLLLLSSSYDSQLIADLLGGIGLPRADIPPALAADNDLDDDNDGVDDSRIIELHVELSKVSCECSTSLSTPAPYS